jgi:DNA-binding XRE family transcriptional regulator
MSKHRSIGERMLSASNRGARPEALAEVVTDWAASWRREQEAVPATPSIADLMRKWRRLADLSTAVAGSKLGLSRRTIEDIELGRSRAGDTLTRYGLEMLISRVQKKPHSVQNSR